MSMADDQQNLPSAPGDVLAAETQKIAARQPADIPPEYEGLIHSTTTAVLRMINGLPRDLRMAVLAGVVVTICVNLKLHPARPRPKLADPGDLLAEAFYRAWSDFTKNQASPPTPPDSDYDKD
jgi:hypothetical protein